MPIIGFNITKVLANKVSQKDLKKEKIERVNILPDLKIEDIEEEKIPIGKQEDILKFNFEFKVTYEPKIGEIVMKGNVLYLEDPKVIKEVVKKWKKDKTIEPEVMKRIFTAILTKCNVRALTLAEEVNLPPHINLPNRVEIAKKPEDYIA